MPRKPNYDQDKRRKEQDRKNRKEAKRLNREQARDERRAEESPETSPLPADPEQTQSG